MHNLLDFNRCAKCKLMIIGLLPPLPMFGRRFSDCAYTSVSTCWTALMTLRKVSGVSKMLGAILATICPMAFAQGPAPDAPSRSIEPTSSLIAPQPTYETHRFFNRTNRILFLAVAGANAADFAVTRSNLQSGGHELDPIVRLYGRSTPGLAVNFAAETAGTVALSYFCHKTGHHKLERIVSFVDIGSSATAVGFGLAHR